MNLFLVNLSPSINKIITYTTVTILIIKMSLHLNSIDTKQIELSTITSFWLIMYKIMMPLNLYKCTRMKLIELMGE